MTIPLSPDQYREWVIRDRHGAEQATHCRKDRPGAKKQMWWKDGLGGRHPSTLPFYRIETLNGNDRPVVVVEGEKAADALAARGFAVVAHAAGAEAGMRPIKEVVADLAGYDVVLWPDNDQVGRELMDHIARYALPLVTSLKRIEWAGAPDKGDAADAVGVDVVELISQAKAEGIDRATLWERLGSKLGSELDDSTPPPLLVDRIDPLGHTILFGPGGVGKGALSTSWVTQLVASGKRVAIFDYENHEGEWGRRMKGLGCDLGKVRWFAPLTFKHDPRAALWDQIELLKMAVEQFEADVVLVDSIVMACMGIDPSEAEAATRYTAAIEYLGKPVLSLAHVNRARDYTQPFGSTFWHTGARVTWSLHEENEVKLLTNRKANNYEKVAQQRISMDWADGRLVYVGEKANAQFLRDKIVWWLKALGSSTVGELTGHINEDNAEEEVKPTTVRRALQRSNLFKSEGAHTPDNKWSLA